MPFKSRLELPVHLLESQLHLSFRIVLLANKLAAYLSILSTELTELAVTANSRTVRL